MHKTSGQRDPAAAFPLPVRRDDGEDRRQANRAIAVSAAGLAATGLAELLIAVFTGSVGLLGDGRAQLTGRSRRAAGGGTDPGRARDAQAARERR